MDHKFPKPGAGGSSPPGVTDDKPSETPSAGTHKQVRIELKLWLDDVRPAPDGWHWARTADEAIEALRTGHVVEASLDHDLGHCAACEGCTGHLRSPCECRCHLSGTFLVNWMATENVWPATKPRVHSANPVGAEHMRATIDRYWAPPGEDRRWTR